MFKIIIGFVLGLVVAQIGFSGLAKVMDNQIDQVKTQVEQLAK